MSDYAQSPLWSELVLALRERAEAARVAVPELPPRPCSPASLKAFSEALESLAERGGWFDKRSYDAELAACAASDGRLHRASDWDMANWEYPGDPSPKATTRTFGIGSLRGGLVTAQFRPDKMGTGADAAMVYMEYAAELLRAMRHIPVVRRVNGILPNTWGGPDGDTANRERFMTCRFVYRSKFSFGLPGIEGVEVPAGGEHPFFAPTAYSLRAGEVASHGAWVDSIGSSRNRGAGDSDMGIALWYWSSYNEQGERLLDVPVTLQVEGEGLRGREAPWALGRAQTYVYKSALVGDPGTRVLFVDPGLVAEEEPSSFEFTAACAGRLLLHVCAPAVEARGRSGTGMEGSEERAAFDGGGVWERGWNALPVQAGVNILARPHLPPAPQSTDILWRAPDGAYGETGSGITETVGCVVDQMLFEPAFSHLAA